MRLFVSYKAWKDIKNALLRIMSMAITGLLNFSETGFWAHFTPKQRIARAARQRAILVT